MPHHLNHRRICQECHEHFLGHHQQVHCSKCCPVRGLPTSTQKLARSALYKALRVGTIVRQPCEVCGATHRIHAHHDDYSKPLAIRWLCSLHHRQHHARLSRAIQEDVHV